MGQHPASWVGYGHKYRLVPGFKTFPVGSVLWHQKEVVNDLRGLLMDLTSYRPEATVIVVLCFRGSV